ncbi:hypothetical protein EZS27_031484 [termite gut metagenome]|uniref:Uncharacterized protein n=1 Tax=termite gut metagenome TaxID=433724 RepID=A0A5J4Q9Q2_9ZZZZ
MDTFYNTRNLSFSQKIDLLRDCKDICYTWWVDKLECSVSLSRQQIEMSFDKIMEKFNESAHFVVADRTFFPIDAIKHFEIAFRAMTVLDYFLWIRIEDEKMQKILEKYGMNTVLIC